MTKELREYFARIGRKGGQAKTPAKRKATRQNAAKARHVLAKQKTG